LYTGTVPPEIVAKRTLFRKMKQEKEAGNIAWVFYDKLYANGENRSRCHRYINME
jgi:hypothetical protein